MTKKALVEAIERDGAYEAVKIDASGNVTGRCAGEPVRYNSDTNTGGSRLVGTDTELLAALVESRAITAEQADTYKY